MPQSRSPRKASRSRRGLAAIAARTDLSVSTVSRALRGMAGIHPSTREQVKRAAAEIGYAARGGGASKTAAATSVLVLSQGSGPSIGSRYILGISEASLEAGVSVMSHHVPFGECASLLDRRRQPLGLREGLVRGVIFLHRWPVPVVEEIAAKVPAVSIVHEYPGVAVDHVGVDDRGGVGSLVNHLRERGYRRIGLFGIHPDLSWARSRRAAYLEAMLNVGIEPLPSDQVSVGLEEALSTTPFPDSGWGERVERAMAGGVDAWLCASGMTAIALLAWLNGRGHDVPGRVGLASMHGLSACASGNFPSITTTDLSDETLGVMALHRLCARMEAGHLETCSVLLRFSLVEGDTTRR